MDTETKKNDSATTTLHAAMKELQKANSLNKTDEIGACNVTLPDGSVRCYQMTPDQCSKVNGTYYGGPCA